MSVAGMEGAPETETEETQDTETPETETPEQGAAEQPKETRKDRQAARVRMHQENESLRNEIKEARERQAAMEQSIAEMRGYLTAKSEHESRQQVDPVQAQIDKLDEEAQAHLANAANAKSPEIAQRELKAYHAKLRESAKLEARQGVQSDLEQSRRSAPDHETIRAQSQLSAEFKWLGEDEAATAAAMALERKMIASGKPPTLATSRAAAAEVAKRMGLGGHTPPTEGQKSAYSGVRSGQGSAGDGARASVDAGNLADWQKKLAEKTFPTLEAGAAHKAWASAMNKHFAKKDQ